MYLGYQINQKTNQEFIAFASPTRDLFEQYIEVDEKDEHGEPIKVKKYLYPTTKITETSEPVQMINGQYYVGQSAIDDATYQKLSKEVHDKRRTLLEESDLWMLNDRFVKLTTEQQEELVKYRQDLRDVTEQPGYPSEITWPTKPEWF